MSVAPDRPPIDFTCPMCRAVYLLRTRFVSHCVTHVRDRQVDMSLFEIRRTRTS